MTPNEYIELAHRTNSLQYHNLTPQEQQLDHAARGLCTEAGELNDALKRKIHYGKPIDFINVTEELGDCLWYIACACKALDISMETLFKQNIAKLATRYPEKFTAEAAYKRDLDAERKKLEEEMNKGFIPRTVNTTNEIIRCKRCNEIIRPFFNHQCII